MVEQVHCNLLAASCHVLPSFASSDLVKTNNCHVDNDNQHDEQVTKWKNAVTD